MKVLKKIKPVTKRERNVSVIIEEAALRNITLIINGENGRYAINVGDYLGKNIKHSIEVLEKAKAEAKANEEADEETENVDNEEEDGEDNPEEV